jgi:hypothetical protein
LKKLFDRLFGSLAFKIGFAIVISAQKLIVAPQNKSVLLAV